MKIAKRNNRTITIWHWLLPVVFLLIHLFFLPKLYSYYIKIALHWLCYVLLFIYLLVLDDIQQVFEKFRKGIGKRHYMVKALLMFFLSFTSAMLLVINFSKQTNPMYRLWVPISTWGLLLWVFAYIFLQPLVDNVLYHKWLFGIKRTVGVNMAILAAGILRTYMETGIFIYNKDTPIPEDGFLALAFFVAEIVFTIFYLTTKDESLTYIGEVLYRIAVVMTVLIGMPQLLPFIG